ncbi:uncharacterized protein LOC123003733 [Tribolium madens]|uniref:uncharacterized protein LOC123003733 n=1 Tax=Tribolium madens TaxID=41895 RepID=UPI001CF75087|nr:uncharacterized protein LOC123003733 [Tribolium madens]
MDTEFYNLHKALSSYKTSIKTSLDKIDDILSQAMNDFTSCDYASGPNTKKYTISLEIVTLLPHYIRILSTVENLADGLATKVSNLERSVEPERDACNPFTSALLSDSKECAISSFFHNLKAEIAERDDSLSPGVGSDVSSDAETLVSQPVYVKNENLDNYGKFNLLDVASKKTVSESESSTSPEPENVTDRADNVANNSVLEQCETGAKRKTTFGGKEEPPVQKNAKTDYPSLIKFSEDFDNVSSEAETLVDQPVYVKNKVLNDHRKFNPFYVAAKNPDSDQNASGSENSNSLESHYDTDRPIEFNTNNVANNSELDQPKTGAKKKKTVRIKEEPIELSPLQLTHEDAETEYSALTKLLEMSVYDRRREAQKKFEKKGIKRELQWTTVTSPSRNSEKKFREKIAIFDILEDELQVGQKCVFSYIVSPSEFYVHTNQELFELLQNSLNEDMNNQHQWVVNKYKSKAEARTHLGNFCFAFLPDKRKWYRVEVLDWLMEDETPNICIQLIDFGETWFFQYEILLPMTEFYSMFPRMAIRCHFSAIYSPDSNRWPQSSIEALEQMSEMEEKTEFVTIFVYKEGNSYGVDLLNEEKFGKKTLGQILVETDLAVEVDISDGIEALEDDDFEEYENINEAISGYDAKDEARLCPFTNSSGRCFKGARCKLEHGFLSEDGVTTDKILTMNQALSATPLPSKGQYIDVVITGYINTCNFYAHIITNPCKSSNFNSNFQRLRETMNSNNKVHTYETFKLDPGLGEVVLVKENSEWFRGICVGFCENDIIEVFFVDFGCKREKKLKDLRQMKEDLLYVPFQAVECILEGCQEKKDTSKEASQAFFETCMNLKTFKALVVDSDEPLRLRLWDLNNMEMGYVLKMYNLGEDRHDVFPVKDCYLSCG